MKRLIPLIIFISFFGCDPQPSSPKTSWKEIAGRDEAAEQQAIRRYPVYRAKVPLAWKRIDPLVTESNQDTTKPLVEYVILEGSSSISITIHNFPSEKIEERIPTQAQVARWKRQLSDSDDNIVILPEAYGGFSGYRFSGSGKLKDEEVSVLGWAMQLAPEHYRRLQTQGKDEEKHFFNQMRSDYTIKAVGPSSMVSEHAPDIVAFAHSFELIQEIPSK